MEKKTNKFLPIIATLLVLFLFGIYFHRSNQGTPVETKYSQESKSNVPDPIIPPLTLESVFSNDRKWLEILPQEEKIVLIATGDVIPARVVNQKVMQMGNFDWPYIKTADTLKTGDITFINLETPLFDGCPILTTGFTFCGEDEHIQGLILSGVDVVSLANNHAGNFGYEKIIETQKNLEDAGILVTGINGPVYKQVKGITFAFLGFNDIGGRQQGISWAQEEFIKQKVSQAKENADVVVVTYHWGTEYQSQPDSRQIYLGHLTVDAGADLIIGNHPHWIQPIEFYNGKVITYAHGNFIFDQEWSQKTKEGVVGKYTFYHGKLIDIEFLPVLIEDWGQPYFLQGAEKRRILDEMKEESKKLAESLRVN